MKQLNDRLRQWAEIQKVPAITEAADLSGGRDAEILLQQLIRSSHAFRDGHVYAGRRIPSKRQGRRREIDLIICTPKMIHLIEVKNWSGRLEIRDGRWWQNRRGGDVVDHGDLIRMNLLKRDAIVEYLLDRGVALDDKRLRGYIVTEIIFMNRRLELDAAIEALPEIITRRELDRYLGRQPQAGLARQMLATLIELCLNAESKRAGQTPELPAEPIPPAEFRQITTFLSETTTWDQLHLYGTKIIAGDLLRLQLGLNTYQKRELVELTGYRPIRLRWTRNWLLGLLKATTGFGSLGRLHLGKSRLPIAHADTVTFHAVGEEEPRAHRLVELEQIVLG